MHTFLILYFLIRIHFEKEIYRLSYSECIVRGLHRNASCYRACVFNSLSLPEMCTNRWENIKKRCSGSILVGGLLKFRPFVCKTWELKIPQNKLTGGLGNRGPCPCGKAKVYGWPTCAAVNNLCHEFVCKMKYHSVCKCQCAASDILIRTHFFTYLLFTVLYLTGKLNGI